MLQLTDIIYLALFLAAWFILVTKVLPRFGIGT
jgi:hypothetical protein